MDKETGAGRKSSICCSPMHPWLYNFPQRYYDSRNVKWLTLDPIGIELMVRDAGSVQSLNWYNYCNNNPILYSDPEGLESEKVLAENEQKKGVAKYQAAAAQAAEKTGLNSVNNERVEKEDYDARQETTLENEIGKQWSAFEDTVRFEKEILDLWHEKDKIRIQFEQELNKANEILKENLIELDNESSWAAGEIVLYSIYFATMFNEDAMYCLIDSLVYAGIYVGPLFVSVVDSASVRQNLIKNNQLKNNSIDFQIQDKQTHLDLANKTLNESGGKILKELQYARED